MRDWKETVDIPVIHHPGGWHGCPRLREHPVEECKVEIAKDARAALLQAARDYALTFHSGTSNDSIHAERKLLAAAVAAFPRTQETV